MSYLAPNGWTIELYKCSSGLYRLIVRDRDHCPRYSQTGAYIILRGLVEVFTAMAVD